MVMDDGFCSRLSVECDKSSRLCDRDKSTCLELWVLGWLKVMCLWVWVIEPQIDFYKGLIADNCLDNKSKRKQERIERAQQEARREAKELEEKRRRATTE